MPDLSQSCTLKKCPKQFFHPENITAHRYIRIADLYSKNCQTRNHLDRMRRIYNPIQKDYVTFRETFSDTDGKRTVADVELAPGGGVGIHYHKTYVERFDVTEGELKVQLGKEIVTLTAGQTATAEKNIVHRFFSESDKVCKFRVTLIPASRGFEESLQIGYGLAADGQCDKKGFPKDRRALAWLFSISESNIPGWRSIFEPLLLKQAKKAIEKGIDVELRNKYVRF